MCDYSTKHRNWTYNIRYMKSMKLKMKTLVKDAK